MLTREELRQEVRNLLAEAALIPTFGVEESWFGYQDIGLSTLFREAADEGFRDVWFHEVRQTDQRFVLFVAVPTGQDDDEYCAALEAFIDAEGVTVETYPAPTEEDLVGTMTLSGVGTGGLMGEVDFSDFGKRTRPIPPSGPCPVSLWTVPPGYRSPYTGKRTKLLPPAAHGPARTGRTGKPARW